MAISRFRNVISTHTLTWSVTVWFWVTHAEPTHFNSHAHVERDLQQSNNIHPNLPISTHTLTWSVTSFNVCISFLRYFNSHAHVERDPRGNANIPRSAAISTHTLTWSVTYLVNAVVGHLFISTHTLTWSVTCSFVIPLSSDEDFNSHAHVERDIWYL